MGADTRVRTVNFDWMEPARQVRVHIDQDEARRLGVSSNAIAAVLNASVTGSTITQVRDDIYLVNVVARATESERASFETLVVAAGAHAHRAHGAAGAVRAVHRGAGVPAGLAARPRADADGARGRDARRAARDGRRGIAPVDRRPTTPSCRGRTAIETGGLYESSNDSSANVFSVVPMMILLMLLFMMILLTSFRRLAMVVAHHAAGADRRRRRAAAVPAAAGLRRHPRHPRADRHDRQERGDPDRFDRDRARRRARASSTR